MAKKQKIIAVLLLIFSINISLQAQKITLSSINKIEAGKEFLFTVNIPSNSMSGISKIEVELPNGFQTEWRNKANANFKFENQVATFQWLKFPEDSEIEISLNITIPPNIDGYYVIKANAYFFRIGEPIKINIEPKVILVIKNDAVSEKTLLEQKEKTLISYKEFKSEGVACIRQVPFIKNNEVIVNLLVSKGNFNKYGKIQETIPIGYKAVNIKSHNAMFVYNKKKNVIKYLWMNMPEKEKFIVSYKLIPLKNIDESSPFLIFGDFYYSDNNQTKVTEIKERGIELSNVE